MSSENNLNINLVEYKKLCKLYKRALKEGKEIFIFQDKEILTNYAKYIIEYLKLK